MACFSSLVASFFWINTILKSLHSYRSQVRMKSCTMSGMIFYTTRFKNTISLKSPMSSKLECLVAISFELIIQASRQEVHLPASIVEWKLVAVTSFQYLTCPKISKKLASSVIVLSQEDSSLRHSNFLWISFSLVSLDLVLYDFFLVFLQADASFGFFIDAVSMRMNSCVEWSLLKIILRNKLHYISYYLEASINPYWCIISIWKPLVRTYLDHTLLLHYAQTI